MNGVKIVAASTLKILTDHPHVVQKPNAITATRLATSQGIAKTDAGLGQGPMKEGEGTAPEEGIEVEDRDLEVMTEVVEDLQVAGMEAIVVKTEMTAIEVIEEGQDLQATIDIGDVEVIAIGTIVVIEADLQ